MDAQAKTQVIERIKQANNILVTVSTDPSVDQLATCLGLTLLLSKMDKRATAVFSGKVPPILQFLEPNKIIEPNTDSLRDFIISLDKNKADKLRYKVEDQFVRIFITPYKTSLSENDLEFSQGDFNVEVVVALGVKDKAHIDAAITAHGRILHDATVITINATGDKPPDIGQINWLEPSASSLAEMIVNISEAFGNGLIDSQMANAFLTGIVAETERFKNTKTGPKVMTIAAQLMAAGANQQLIVSKLEPPAPPPLVPAIPNQQAGPPIVTKPKEEGTLSVSHKTNMPDSGEVEVDAKEIRIDEQGNLKTAAELLTEAQKQKEQPKTTEKKDDKKEPEPEEQSEPPAKKDDKKENSPPGPHSFLDSNGSQPSFSAITSADRKPEEQMIVNPLSEDKEKNSGILEHGPVVVPATESETSSKSATETKIEEEASQPSVESARNAVESALSDAAYNPASDPIAALNAQPVPEESKAETSAKTQEKKDEERSKAEKTEEDKIAPVAPPPVPPPLTFDPGIFDTKNDKK